MSSAAYTVAARLSSDAALRARAFIESFIRGMHGRDVSEAIDFHCAAEYTLLEDRVNTRVLKNLSERLQIRKFRIPRSL
jgi:hypothetical protein